MHEQRDEQTYAIIGAAMEVHRHLSSGFLEAVYHDALSIEFETREIPFVREPDLPVMYKGKVLGSPYRADFLCYDRVVVEIKAVSDLNRAHEAQIIHYLRATGRPIGLLLNFGSSSLQHRRFIQSV
ncbi:MAG: GxxExxY protein [Planctomycetota bacterium]